MLMNLFIHLLLLIMNLYFDAYLILISPLFFTASRCFILGDSNGDNFVGGEDSMLSLGLFGIGIACIMWSCSVGVRASNLLVIVSVILHVLKYSAVQPTQTQLKTDQLS